MKKSELKSLIKECLVELLAEGLGRGLNESLSRSGEFQPGSFYTNGRPVPVRQPQKKHDPILDRRVLAPKANSALNEAIKVGSKGDPILADLLADTARTTLQSQFAAGDSQALPSEGSNRIVQQEQFNGSPEEVFGEETASRWANLAFASPQSNLRS